jgi:hypothetical protein
MNPTAMFASAHHGVASGEPMYVISQLKVTMPTARPYLTPKSWKRKH